LTEAGDDQPEGDQPEPGQPEPGQRGATFRDVFAIAEFRALWSAQLLSVAGDQLARVALTVLVYQRTRSPLLAAVTFTASLVPNFLGGMLLSPIADRLPRRRVMIGTDLVSLLLVAVMAVPGVPLAVLIVLLAAVTMAGALFQAARAANMPDVLPGDRYVLGTAVTITTIQFAQVLGFAVGGVAVAFLGLRTALLADAATFAASALIARIWVRARPAAQPPGEPTAHPGLQQGRLHRLADHTAAGLRLVFGRPALRTPMLFGWLCAFYNVPEGVATPLAGRLGGGASRSAVAVGLILASAAFGSTIGALCFSRFVPPDQRIRWISPLAAAACGLLVLFAARPGLAGVLIILAGSGLCTCYQLAANASFVKATPPGQRSQAFGIAQGGINLGQGLLIVLAGAADERYSPDAVICAGGAVGAVCALVLAGSGLLARLRPARRGESWG
jgi:predicted MFS family arabinose efflux permease